MKINQEKIIPDAYVGREQAYIKHLLLEGYLERLLYIVGYNAHMLGHREVTYIDCFAGPWKDESADLSSTSIGISLRLLARVKEGLKKVSKHVSFRAIYVERDSGAYSRLDSFLRTCAPPEIQTTSFHGDFVERIPDILTAVPTDSFAFFFIDPKGWTVVKPDVLRPLLCRQHSEFLINLMYDFANRFLTKEDQRMPMSELFDQDIDAETLPSDPTVRELYLLGLYRVAITKRARHAGTRAMTSYVSVLDPLADRTKYHLIYLTRHPKGVIEFMTQSEQLAPVQDAVRTLTKFNKKAARSDTEDMFGLDISQQPTSQKNAERMQLLETLWLSKFVDGKLTASVDIFAVLLSESDCFPAEVQEAIRRLINRGVVKNLSAKDISRRTRNVVNFEKKEMLQLLQQGT